MFIREQLGVYIIINYILFINLLYYYIHVGIHKMNYTNNNISHEKLKYAVYTASISYMSYLMNKFKKTILQRRKLQKKKKNYALLGKCICILQ